MCLLWDYSKKKKGVSSAFLVVFVLILNCQLVISNEMAYFTKLNLPPNVTGSESLAFNTRGDEFYTGVADGRILKHQSTNHSLVDFATTSPLRTKAKCDGKNDANLTQLCGRGRPLGVAFRSNTGGLYITDIAYGLLVVGSNGGLATSIANSVNGVPFEFLDSVDVDPNTHAVYFTDAGAIFRRSLNLTEILLSGDTSGKLLKYDPETNQVTLLLTGLSGANGVAVDRYGEFVLVTEYINKRIRRYWIKGHLAGSSDIFIDLGGSPDNIKRTVFGDFWVAVTYVDFQQPMPKVVPVGQKLNRVGVVVETFDLQLQYKGPVVSEVEENGGLLLVGSLFESFIGRYGR